MSISIRRSTNTPATPRELTCRLRKKTEGRAATSPLAGELELENVSSTPIEIVYHSSPLQHLDLVVEDEHGTVVSEGHYGDLFSPSAQSHTLRLEPGEKYVANVSFLATVPTKQRHGTYCIRAVYRHETILAESPAYLLELEPS